VRGNVCLEDKKVGYKSLMKLNAYSTFSVRRAGEVGGCGKHGPTPLSATGKYFESLINIYRHDEDTQISRQCLLNFGATYRSNAALASDSKEDSCIAMDLSLLPSWHPACHYLPARQRAGEWLLISVDRQPGTSNDRSSSNTVRPFTNREPSSWISTDGAL
jgi:hypothetical protein